MKLGQTFAGAVSMSLVVPMWAVAQTLGPFPNGSPVPLPAHVPTIYGENSPLPDDQPRATPEQKLKIWGADSRYVNGCRGHGMEAPCAAMGVAGLPSSKTVKTAIGNPVNPQTGQKVQVDLDAEPLGGPLGLEIRRHYNSALGSVKGALGKAWHLSYDTRLLVARKTVQIIQADGVRRIFLKPESGTMSTAAGGVVPSGSIREVACVSSSPEDGHLSLLPEGGYRWVWPDGRVLDFNTTGWLIRISIGEDAARVDSASVSSVVSATGTGHAAAGQARGAFPSRSRILTITRAPDGKILQVTDPAGRTMRFRYDVNGYLMAIDHPQGTWRYRVSADGHLQSVQSPAGNRRFFRYEDTGFPSALTAIEIESPQLGRRVTISQWRYNIEGKVREYKGWKGEDMRFVYLPTDSNGIETTEVLDRHGRKQIYRFQNHGGMWQTLSITGQDCAHCRLADREYHYDNAGRLAGMHQWRDTKRQRLHREFIFERDYLGRMLAVYQRTWRQKKAVDGRLRDNPAQVAWQLFRRYDYADDVNPNPTLIERPSIEPGRMYQVRFAYDFIAGRQLPVRITETGYSHGEEVSRTVHAHYDDQGVLQQIDGPLPGPEDTVRVQYHRQDDGQRTWVLIDGLGREISRDAGTWAVSSMAWLEDAGHFHAEVGTVRYDADNGARTSIHMDDFNRITQIVSADAGTDTIWYDVADRVVKETDSTGATGSFTHDAWDRPLIKTIIRVDGFREETRYRYEGRWLAEVKGVSSTERYLRDGVGRMIGRQVVIHPAGAPETKTFSYRYSYTGDSLTPDSIQMPDGAVISRHPFTPDNGGPAAMAEMASGRTVHADSRGGSSAAQAVETLLKDGPDDSKGQLLYRRTLVRGDTQGQGYEDHWQLGNGYERRMFWNGSNQLSALHEYVPGAGARQEILHVMRYGYLPNGKIARIDTMTESNRYHYDNAGRLIIAQKKPYGAPRQGTGNGLGEVVSSSFRKVRSTTNIQSTDPAVPARWYAYDDNGNRLFTGTHSPGKALAGPFVGDIHGSQTTYVAGTDHRSDVNYDAAGRPLNWNGWDLTWHPGGQIMAMKHTDGREIRYFYNHRGERIARQQGNDWQFYDYENGRLQTQTSAGGESIRYWWYEGEIPVAVIERGPRKKGFLFSRPGELNVNWLHVDHRGLPLARTDAGRRIVWQQGFGPFGESETAGMNRGSATSVDVTRVQTQATLRPVGAVMAGSGDDSSTALVPLLSQSTGSGFAFGVDPMLRLPGQWADAATGLYYNMKRDYGPMMGRYVSPDPLGVRAGPNPYLYAGADPLRNVDPTGLMLFAFDGTYNAPDAPTNVWYFHQLYNTEANGPGRVTRPYLEGVGVAQGPDAAYGRTMVSVTRETLEPIFSWKWKDNVEFQVMRFMKAVEDLKEDETLNIDVVGFSRGAVQALEFGRIVARMLNNGEVAHADRVKLRFMGLMDPVMTNMYSGVDGWEQKCKPMDVDDRWENVLNIVAAHDRRGILFKGASLGSQINMRPNGDLTGLDPNAVRKLRRDPATGGWTGIREEIVLAGAHSDIGGGWRSPESKAPDSDLSDASLWVLMDRAEHAGVVMHDLPDYLKRIDLPVNHKNSGSIMNLAQGRDGRTYLVDGEWKDDAHLGFYGVKPDSRLHPFKVEPENEIGMFRDGRDDPVVHSASRIPESKYWQQENSMDMSLYCKFLLDKAIFYSSKYAENCRQAINH